MAAQGLSVDPCAGCWFERGGILNGRSWADRLRPAVQWLIHRHGLREVPEREARKVLRERAPTAYRRGVTSHGYQTWLKVVREELGLVRDVEKPLFDVELPLFGGGS